MSTHETDKPCPFCGGTELVQFDLYADHYEGPAVECLCCHAEVPLIWWNKRVTVTRECEA